MIITSATVGFNSQHEKSITDSSQQQSLAQEREVSLSAAEAQNWQSGTRVDLSYDAKMRSQKASAVNSVSTIQSEQERTQIAQSQNVRSLVETVLHKDIQLERLQVRTVPNLANLPRIDLLAQPVSAQLYQEVDQLSFQDFQATLTAEQLEIDITDTRLDAGIVGVADTARVDIAHQRIYTEEEKLNVGSLGVITTADGREISFMLELEMERSFKLEESFKEERVSRSLIDPLVINLHGGAAGLTNSSFSFDLNADGSKEDISFVSQGSGFLALDINNDGKINDGSELFGTQGQDGFSHLAEHDTDNNRWIDENDEIFSKLKVWSRDAEGNDQLVSLKEAGVGAIYLGSTSSSFDLTDDQNNLLGQVKRSGVFLMEDGAVSSIQELDIAVHEAQPSSGGLANQYDQAVERFGQRQDLDGGTSFAEGPRRLTLLDMLIEQERLSGELDLRREGGGQSSSATEIRERYIEERNSSESSSSSKEVTTTGAEDEENNILFVDSERLSVLERLREKTDVQLVEERNQYDYLKEIIETLKHIDRKSTEG